MPVPTNISDLSTTASSNSPPGSEGPQDGDNYIRQYGAFIATLRDQLNGTSGTGTINDASFTGTMTGAATWSSLQTFQAGISVQSTSGNVFASTYSPTATEDVNFTSIVAQTTMYSRIQDEVSVSGRLTGTTTAGGNTLTRFYLSLPVASAMTASENLCGSGTALSGAISDPVMITADTTGDRAYFQWGSTAAAPWTINYKFSYRIL